MGGQTGLNCALDLAREGVLEKYNVEMIAASREAIDMAEDRDLFRKAMTEIGLEVPHGRRLHTRSKRHLRNRPASVFRRSFGPSFTLGGTGGGIAYNREEFERIVVHGLEMSPTTEVLLEESVIGWKEFEMEVVRDRNDNCIIVCSIENLDPMGVHTGDSITVAPAQTLTDKEYQRLRNASIDVLRKIGVETGGSNVQFADQPGGWARTDYRDEPACVAIVGAGFQGHRISDRQGRCKAGYWVHTGRTPERHHGRRNSGLV